MKRYEDLNITDNFMFCKVFSNEDVAKDFLQDVLKIKIDKITVVGEATTQEDPFHKGVRFDVAVKEDVVDEAGNPSIGRYFDIELQMIDTGELPKRARYYQGMCDLDVLARGVSYTKLQEQYILFICPEDIFEKDKSVYCFQNREESDPSILMGDLCYKNFYIFNKYSEIEDDSTREYMRYFATKTGESDKMRRINELVERYRRDPITKKAYMTLEQELNLRYEKGHEKGRAEGHAEGVAEGADSKNRELAKAFRDAGFPVEIISEKTKLSIEEIKAL
ncbi:MAG: Rpn family recombination-promoting nuclease/putative transposase [Fibrobacter sp.]|nr:Rpn family recombination-promoting nuclease/putative transposase [Fibrobacter sp.]